MTRSRQLALAVLAAALVAPGSVLAGQGGPPAPTTPIEHFIVLMQENHSFDNYFGTYPGADGIPEGTCMPWDPGNASKGCVESFHVGGRAIVDLHDRPETHVAQYRNGRMDGFVAAFAERGPIAATTMGYYDDRDLPLY
ncbi:MAG TPA: alkaline phosphatase family protein, partial [Gaiellaceae bacterium]|nr:alkaline phosphatase family protein [Gaiellaceae bacterium]